RPAGTPMNILSCPDRTGSPKSRVFGVFLQVSDPVHPILSISVDRTLDRTHPVQPDRIGFATQHDHSSACRRSFRATRASRGQALRPQLLTVARVLPISRAMRDAL